MEEDLWISSVTGKILHSQEVFYEHQVVPDRVVDLKGKILAPGFIDVQFNGAFGFDFSSIPPDMGTYKKGVSWLNRELVKTGVTSYLPTITSQRPEVYHEALKYLGPSGGDRNASDGAESLGAHCEGPFISPTKQGIHSPEVLREAPNGFSDLQACYGAENLLPPSSNIRSPIRIITAAPEVPGIASAIPQLKDRGIIVSMGHTEATFEEATAAVEAGAGMITHLFNAMRPLHHRNPGIFGILGKADHDAGISNTQVRPYYGVIADGIHLHPTTVKFAWEAHHDGFILVTDALMVAGLPDGTYDWTNGDRITKKGLLVTREGAETLAGSASTLIECASNFWNWTHATIPQVMRAVTTTPARMLGLESVKGKLEAHADADLLVLDEEDDTESGRKLSIDQVWKFGKLVHEAAAVSSEV